jgi:hypothetical protein
MLLDLRLINVASHLLIGSAAGILETTSKIQAPSTRETSKPQTSNKTAPPPEAKGFRIDLPLDVGD